MTTIVTPSQTCGPLFGFALLPPDIHQSVPEGHPDAIVIEGDICDFEGKHLGFDAFVEVWSAEQACRARTFDGRFRVVVVKPRVVRLPGGKPQAPHLHIALFARGLTRHLLTRIYFPHETAANARDPVLQLLSPERRQTLIATPRPDHRHLAFDIRLQGAGETAFLSTRLAPQPGQ